MSRRFIASLLVIAAASIGTGVVSHGPVLQAAPEPSVVPQSWQLNLKHGSIERLIMPINGKPTTFWYMRYTVTNNSGKDVLFTPEFELVTDTGQVQPAFKNVPNEVFLKIKEAYKNTLLETPTGILGKLLQGDDNAKDGVMIFGDMDGASRTFQVYMAGLSGETAEVTNPLNKEPVVLQKTLVLEYNLPGEAIGIDPQPQLKSTKWVMK